MSNIECNKVRVTVMAVNKLTNTPSASVRAKPLTMLAPNWLPNQNKITQVIKVEIFESRIDGQARRKPSSTAVINFLPERNSSYMRSKIKMLAYTATPTDNTKPAMPGRVSVTGINLNKAKVIVTYNNKAITANTPGKR